MSSEIAQAEIDRIIDLHGARPSAAIPILQAIQERYNYLPREALQRVCAATEITPAALSGIATFYSQFRLRPAGRHTVKVCVGTACHVMGADAVDTALRRQLAIPEGDDTDPQRLFTVERVACLGCCMLAPAVQIDDVTFGLVRPQGVDDMLRTFLAEQSAATGGGEEQATNGKPRVGEVRTCLCSSCTAAGSGRIHRELGRQIASLDLPVVVKVVGCTGMAYQTPLVEVAAGNGQSFRYGRIRTRDVRPMLLDHFRPVSLRARCGAAVTGVLEKVLTDESWQPVSRLRLDTERGPDATFVEPQRSFVTEHGGRLTPLDLDEYLGHDGFVALRNALFDLSAEETISRVEVNGLRGRGGAGFPTATKWRLVSQASGAEKYVICNGDEGDPGAFMDRMILESFPFRVIEGMLIGARAVGACRGFFYIRAEYPVALERIRQALQLCREQGYLGGDILGSGFSFDIEVVAGAGAFVCGEETALIAAIEGRRGMPRLRPPYPAERGLWERPTLVNNVETLAAVPGLVREGLNGFAALGTTASRGTKTFALAGKVARSGLIEVPMGMTLRDIVERIGGGVPGGRALKAIQVGGPSGGCVPASLCDIPVDYEALAEAGAMMGSGGLVVLDSSDCMVDIARYFMAFTQAESCGKCTFCRVGTRRMLEILDRLCQGRGQPGDLERLQELARSVQRGSLCGLGKTAPNPVLSTLLHFRSEYEAHLQGRCPAGACTRLVTYSITEGCIGCTLCAQHCAAGAIELRPYQQHRIDPHRCTRCGTCRQVCPEDTVRVE